jgi:hypothetical protein
MAAAKGNSYARKAKDWEDALRRSLSKHSSGMALALIADKVVAQALEGEWRAIEEIANRIDGKPAQAIEHTGDIGHRHYSEMTEEQLERIASGSSDGAIEQASRPPLDS